jgi:YD repeat-containing protein
LFQRILNEYEDSVARRSATGGVAGVSFVTLLAHGKTNKNVDYYTNSGKWRACIELPKGTNHAITVRAHHPSGQIIASRTNTYSVSSFDYQATTYDAAGFITQRVLRADTGQNTAIQRTQTLTWDAWGRLVTVTERDDVNDGYDWVGTYDGLGRLLRTTYTPVSANVANANFRVTVDSWYDPQVEFLEIGVAVNGRFTARTSAGATARCKAQAVWSQRFQKSIPHFPEESSTITSVMRSRTLYLLRSAGQRHDSMATAPCPVRLRHIWIET